MKKGFNNAAGPQIRDTRKKNNKGWAIVCLLIFIGGLQASTQSFAHRFNYHPLLGVNLEHIYAPWAILGWSLRWYPRYPQEILFVGWVGIVICAIGFLTVLLVRTAKETSSTANIYLHGSARWAEMKDIIKMSLLPRQKRFFSFFSQDKFSSESIFVGAWVDEKNVFHYLRHPGAEHVLTFAPTRSGKGVGLVLPTLLTWSSSAFILDTKGELWALTAGWRKRYGKNKVMKFQPTVIGEGGVRWNPLDEIRIGTEYEVGDVQNVTLMIVDPDGLGLKDHWQKTAYALLTGVVLHALYKAKWEGGYASLTTVDQMLADPERDINDLWTEMMTYFHFRDEDGGRSHPLIASAGKDMADRPEEEAGSVLSTAKSNLSLYRDPVIAANTSVSDFKIPDLMHHRDPVSLYVLPQFDDKDRLRPLIRLMISMVIRKLANRLDYEKGRVKKNYKHRLLMELDEFPSFGKIQIMEEALAYLAGFGIRCHIIAQDLTQLCDEKRGYGKDQSITSNCHIQNAFPPNTLNTAEHLSKMTGITTVSKPKISTSGSRFSMHHQTSSTIEEVQRPLLTPDECLRMPGPEKDGDLITEAGDMLIFVAGSPAIYGKQPLYFQDPVLQARAEIPAPKESDRLINHPKNEVRLD